MFCEVVGKEAKGAMNSNARKDIIVDKRERRHKGRLLG